jgi:hypothetical protein
VLSGSSRVELERGKQGRQLKPTRSMRRNDPIPVYLEAFLQDTERIYGRGISTEIRKLINRSDNLHNLNLAVLLYEVRRKGNLSLS